jgi:hypothetical protein
MKQKERLVLEACLLERAAMSPHEAGILSDKELVSRYCTAYDLVVMDRERIERLQLLVLEHRRRRR